MLIPSFVTIPRAWHTRYAVLRVLLYIGIIAVTILLALRALFPTLEQTFNFRTPDSSRNTIVDPRSETSSPRTNGKIEAKGKLIANTSALGDFSFATFSIILEENSAKPPYFNVAVKRSFRSFLLENDTPITQFPEEKVIQVEDTFYALRNNTLYPYVSEKAYLSHFDKSHPVQRASEEILNRYNVSEEWLGFRVGSLISNATGVFVVSSETEIRPIGSAEIFLALGYNFDDVISANEEEIGIYKRGRILLLGEPHPDGTVFLDKDTGTYFLTQGGKKHLLVSPYKDFLLKNQHPLVASTEDTTEVVMCTLTSKVFSKKTLVCDTSIERLRNNLGNDYEITLYAGNQAIDINTLTLSLSTDKNTDNMFTLLSQIKQRLLSRFGYGTTE